MDLCTKFFYGEGNEQFSSRLVLEFVIRLVYCGKNNEVWVRLEDYIARFGMQEFFLITGLPCHELVMEIDYNNKEYNRTNKQIASMHYESIHLHSRYIFRILYSSIGLIYL